MKPAPLFWFALCGAALFSDAAAADSVRCGSRFVSTGDTTYDARKVCGDPDFAERRLEECTVKRKVRGPCEHNPKLRCETSEERTVIVTIDRWTYDFGRQRLVHHLTFEEGRLVAVRTGGYGDDDE